MGKVRPFCRSGYEVNILRPSRGLLPEKICHQSAQFGRSLPSAKKLLMQTSEYVK